MAKMDRKVKKLWEYQKEVFWCYLMSTYCLICFSSVANYQMKVRRRGGGEVFGVLCLWDGAEPLPKGGGEEDGFGERMVG